MTGPRNATTTTKGRFYTWHNATAGSDETFNSVTTIIGRGVPKAALKPWGEKMVATAAVKQQPIWQQMSDEEAIDYLKRAPFRDTEKAAAQGSDIHNWAESLVLGHPVTVEGMPEAQRGYGEAFMRFREEMSPTWEMSEASVFSRQYGYAGTLDALMRIPQLGDGLGLVDYKTSRSGIYPEVALQLSAYRYADFVGLADGTEIPMPEIAWCAALHITSSGYHLIPVDAGPLAFAYFTAVQQVADFAESVGKQLLAAEIRPVVVPEIVKAVA
jgi:hypothetical protein